MRAPARPRGHVERALGRALSRPPLAAAARRPPRHHTRGERVGSHTRGERVGSERFLHRLDGRRELLLHGGGAAARLLHLPQALGQRSLGGGLAESSSSCWLTCEFTSVGRG